jgi:hypothetical protein
MADEELDMANDDVVMVESSRFLVPDGCPVIPADIASDELIAIVAVHHRYAFGANQDNTHPLLLAPDHRGCHVYLTQNRGQSTWTFGRSSESARTRLTDEVDVFFPAHTAASAAAKKQFALVPTRETNLQANQTGQAITCWRMDALSRTTTTVNGAVIRKPTSQLREDKIIYPTAVYLDNSKVNHIEVAGTKIDIWFVRPAGYILDLQPEFQASQLSDELQNPKPKVHGKWALHRFMLWPLEEPISNRSYRVVNRFTGKVGTAKMFHGPHTLDGRNREFRLFYKKLVHDSLVQYNERITIDKVPGILTDSHHGMVPYGALQAELKDTHPTYRFRTATAMIRPVFSALEFLHHHRIIHDSENFWDSVLIRHEDNRVTKVLLVDYSSICEIPSEEAMPRDSMVNDGRKAMALIEDCCDIWACRSSRTLSAVSADVLRRKAEDAEKEYNTHLDACRYWFGDKNYDRTTPKSKKLLEVLAEKEMNVARAKANQATNAGLLEIGPLTWVRLQKIVHAWVELKAKSRHDVQQPWQPTIPMVLTLGHEYLDELANKLYHGEWDLTPQDLCDKLRALEGEVPMPWRTFTVTRQVRFQFATTGKLKIRSLVDCIVTYCDIYPESRSKINAALYEFVDAKVVSLPLLVKALYARGVCDRPMKRTLQKLADVMALFKAGHTVDMLEMPGMEFLPTASGCDVGITEEHRICYHVPSRMFNVTQLQHVQSTPVLQKCLANPDVRCGEFAEVRGEPAIQGHYISLSLLPKFAEALELTVSEQPDAVSPGTGFQSDFSGVARGRVILAHTELAAYASVSRTGLQFKHHPTSIETFALLDPFMPTYFGTMKVLPRALDGRVVLPQADHWAKFKRAEDIEEDILRAAKGGKHTFQHRLRDESMMTLAGYKPRHGEAMETAILLRDTIIANARVPPPSTLNKAGPRPQPVPQIKRVNLGVTVDFFSRNLHLLKETLHYGVDANQPFEPLGRANTTYEERAAIRNQAKLWVEEYVDSDSGGDETEVEDPAVIHRAAGARAGAVNPNANTPSFNMLGGTLEAAARGDTPGRAFLKARQAPEKNASIASPEGVEMELADTEMIDWGA